MKRSALLSASILAGLAISASAPAWAQDTSDTQVDEDGRDVLIVTARRQEERLIDVPVSLSVFTDNTIEDLRLENISEISDFTPGFQQQQAFGRDGDRPVIRGASNILIAEGKVGFFIDGVPVTGDVSGLNLDNLDRVEVIKGPQGTQFGRGTLSGAVNFVTKRPGDEPEFRVSGTVGNYETLELQGSASFPITSWLGAYANVSYDTFGGDYDNFVTGGSLNERETLTASGFLYFDPTEDLKASLRLIHSEIDDGHFAIDLQDSSFNNVFPNSRGYFQGEVPTRPDSEFGLNTDEILSPGIERDTTQVLYDVIYDINGSGFELSYLGSYADQEEVAGVDQTYDETAALLVSTPLPFPPFFGGSTCSTFFQNGNCGVTAFNDTSATERTVLTQEIRLSTPRDRRIRGSIGYFYLDEERKGVADFLEATEFGLDSIGDINEVVNNSIFGLVEADITDKLTASAELRYSEDEITRTGQEYVAGDQFSDEFLNTLSNPNPEQVIGNTNSRTETFDNTLPRVTLRYKLSDSLTVFGQYAEGSSPGGFNVEDAPQTTIEEEKLSNFEVGVKGFVDPFNTRFNAAAFFIVYEDQGLTQTFETEDGGFDSFTANIGETEITGFELESVSELFDGFTVASTLSYLDAEITEGNITDQGILLGGLECLSAPGTTGVFTPTPECLELASVEGNTPPLVSDWQGTLSGRYEAALGATGWDYFAGADLIYRSSFFAQVHNLAETGDSTRFNLQGGIENGPLKVTVWGENVFDDDTPSGILRYVDFTPGTANAVTGQRSRAFGITPAAKPTYGVTVSARF